MTDTTADSPPDVSSYIDAAAAAAAGGPATRLGIEAAAVPPPSIADARKHLDAAWEHATAGTEAPPEGRMKQAKKAVLVAMRPVTSHQVQFNQQVSVAVKELAIAIDEMVQHVDRASDSLGDASTRVHAALATVEITVDDVVGGVERLNALIVDLAARTAALEDSLATERGELRALRARQDVVLRSAADAIESTSSAPNQTKDQKKSAKSKRTQLGDELDNSAELLASDLADLVLGTRDEVRGVLAEFISEVEPLAGSPLLDLASNRGEWLELLGEAGLEASGVERRRRAVDEAHKRGLAVVREDPLEHLAGLPDSSHGAITAFGLVDRLSTEAVGLAALRIIRPPGRKARSD